MWAARFMYNRVTRRGQMAPSDSNRSNAVIANR